MTGIDSHGLGDWRGKDKGEMSKSCTSTFFFLVSIQSTLFISLKNCLVIYLHGISSALYSVCKLSFITAAPAVLPGLLHDAFQQIILSDQAV